MLHHHRYGPLTCAAPAGLGSVWLGTAWAGRSMTDNDDLSTTGADPTSELIVAFVHKAQALFLAGGVEVTLKAVLDLAMATIEGCDFAGIFVLEDGRVTTPARTDPLVADVEDRQLHAEMGPCLDAIAEEIPVYAEDLATDPRWPDFGPAAAADSFPRCPSLAMTRLRFRRYHVSPFAAHPLAHACFDLTGIPHMTPDLT